MLCLPVSSTLPSSLSAALKPKGVRMQVCPADFVVRGRPLGLKGTTVFSEFAFDSRPFVTTDHLGRLCDRSQQVRNKMQMMHHNMHWC